MKRAGDKKVHTGLILLTGSDSRAVELSLFETLAPFAIRVLDIEEILTQGRIILATVISCNPAHIKAIESDLDSLAERLKVDIAYLFGEVDEAALLENPIESQLVYLAAEVKPSEIAEILGLISESGGSVSAMRRVQSKPLFVFNISVQGADNLLLESALRELSKSSSIDCAMLPSLADLARKKFFLFDMDSTLIQEEVIDLIASHAGVADEVKAITASAMRGEINFQDALRARVQLLAGVSVSVLDEVRTQINLREGARELIEKLQSLGHEVAVVSGGFSYVIQPLLASLDITNFRANTFEIVDGALTGNLVGPIIDRGAKASALLELSESLGIHLSNTVAIGDGANDLDMISKAGLGIAFSAKSMVRAASDRAINSTRLDSLIFLLGLSG